MRRRTVLAAAALSTTLAGCIGEGSFSGTAEFTVDEPLESVHERGDCGDANVVASASFSDALDEPVTDGVVVRYRDLDAPSRRVVRFYRLHGSAVCCYGDDTLPFRRLLAESQNVEVDYRRTHDEPPSGLFVRITDSYHRLDRITIYDQVYEP